VDRGNGEGSGGVSGDGQGKDEDGGVVGEVVGVGVDSVGDGGDEC
jgi:hypothetical protein